ncbi:hypothetical protein [Mycobacteroides abscessus]
MNPREEPIIIDEDIDLDAETVIVDGQRFTEEMAEAIADEAGRVSRERTPGERG